MPEIPDYMFMFLSVILLSFLLSVLFQTLGAYRQYKRIKLSFESMQEDMEEQLDAFYKKNKPGPNPQLDLLRDQYSKMKRNEYKDKEEG